MSAPAVLSVDPKRDWMTDARLHLDALAVRYIRTRQTFTADDLHKLAGQPDNSRWAGTAFTAAHRAGEIEPTGEYVKSQRKDRKHSVIAVWRAAR